MVFLDGPVKVAPETLPFDTSASTFSADANASDFRSWYPYIETESNHFSMEPAFEELKASIIKDGPYDGIIGFSQGAGVAGILCNSIDSLVPEKQGKFKFAVLYSGFRPHPEFLQKYFSPPISTPTLHIMGSLDTVVSEERSMALYNACTEDSRTLMRHPGGHFVPNSKPFVKSVVEYIESHMNEKSEEGASTTSSNKTEETKKEETPQESWDEFDKIGQS